MVYTLLCILSVSHRSRYRIKMYWEKTVMLKFTMVATECTRMTAHYQSLDLAPQNSQS